MESAKDLIESLAARKIGGTSYLMNSEEVDLAYEVFNDYVMRNEVKGVDVKLPFEVCLGGEGVNLIEQMGYEKAKDYVPDGYKSDRLKRELLEYRREHNIFEVNDQVVLINKPGLSSSLHRVLAVNAPTTIQVCPINQVSGNDLVILGFMASPFYLRHATDAEFAANRKLEGL